MATTPAVDGKPKKGLGNHGNLPGPGPGRKKGGHDTNPRINISVKRAMQTFLDEKGQLVTEWIEHALGADGSDRAGAAAMEAALEYGIGKPGPAEPPRTGRGLVVVLSSQEDPLAARSRPTKPIDLTMSGPVIDAEPAPIVSKARPPAPPATLVEREPARQAGQAKSKRAEWLDDEGEPLEMQYEPPLESEPDNSNPERWTGPRTRGREDW